MADFENYRDMVAHTTPTVFQGFYGERLAGFVAGLMADAVAEGAGNAVKAPWVQRPDFPADAAAPLGRESNLEAYPLETAAQYIARLRRRWQDWQFAGHESAILGQLEAAGYPDAFIYFDPNRLGPNGESPYWSQFWVRWPYGSHPVTALANPWGSFDWGDGTVWGPAGLTLPYMKTIRGIVRKWKPGHWICRGFIFEMPGPTWGSFDWGDGTVYAGRIEVSFGA